MKGARWLYAGALAVALVIGLGFWRPGHVTAAEDGTPAFRVDPFWPKPLPTTVTPDGLAHHWVTGEVAASCIDAQDHVYTYNRGWELGVTLQGVTYNAQSGALNGQDEFPPSIPSPPVVVYDREGNVVAGWGNPSLNPGTAASGAYPAGGAVAGRSTYMPNGAHGCFVDYQGFVWVAGNGDGVVQKYNPSLAAAAGAAATFVAQIGTKDLCDTASGQCTTDAGLNSSHTLLDDPPDVAVDPEMDPVTHTAGSVYIADGYGNHRVAVFTTTDGINYTYNRQFGTDCGTTGPSCGPTQFGHSGGGHPHCVVLGNDGNVYACDRPNSRILVFTKTGDPVGVIRIDPTTSGASAANKAAILAGNLRACDIDFYPNIDYLASKSPTDQNYILDTDLGSDNTWLIDKATGTILRGLGRCGLAPCPGHNAGEFAFGHTVATDSHGDVIVAETITGRRLQKFVRVDN
jgi:NHL repeat